MAVDSGNSNSIDLGSFSIDSNTAGLFDALIAATLRESAKAYQAPPIVIDQASGAQRQIAESNQPQASILGSLASYFGKVAQCNMPWNQITDEIDGTTSNCPTFGQALSIVGQAAADSLREAVDSTLEDAERFAKGPGLMLGLLAGGPEAAILEELTTTAAVAQAGTHLLLSTMESDEDATTDQKAALATIRKEAIDKLSDAFSEELTGLTGVAVGSVNEQVGKEWEAAQDSPIAKVVEKYLEGLKDAPTTLEGPRDETNPDGYNLLDDSVDNAPSVDITGKVTNGSGTGLQNVGVGLTDGNGDDTPISVQYRRHFRSDHSGGSGASIERAVPDHGA